jgi:UDP:flavonoid glycosyltransferase YjiC (YdhE family)
MRVLFTSTPAYGHLQPMLPLARALKSAGDEVAVAIAPEFVPRVQASGFTALTAGDNMGAWWAELVRRHPGEPWSALLPEQILQWFWPHLFVEIGAAAMLRDLVPAAAAWRPDLLIYETFELAGPIAAAVSSIPSVHHTLSPLPTSDSFRLAGVSAAPLWRGQGLEPAPLGGLQSDLCVDICPPSLRNPGAATIDRVEALRPVAVAAVGDEELPPSVRSLRDQPTVHATLGTSATNADQAVLATVIEGLRDEALNIVVTVGPDRDPAALGGQPSNVIVERYLPHALLLPMCALVVSHGGAGTMLAALSHGLPLLTVPQGADQYVNAEACSRRGVGRTVVTGDLTAARVGTEVRTLLGDPGYRTRAQEVQAEIAAMPAPEDIVRTLHYHAAHE